MAAAPLYPDPIDTILEWIGFDSAPARCSIMEESVEDYDDFKMMSESDITELSHGFSKRAAARRIVFGLRRTKRLKLVLHWAQDFYRCSEIPDIEDLDQVQFLAALTVAEERLQVRKSALEKSDQLSREASPGNLDDERKWNTWESGLINYLSTIPGSSGVPLLYVIRENDQPEPDGHPDFTSKCIACAPLNGPHFEADKREVHQTILSLCQGETAEDWIKDVKRQSNGRLDYECLKGHFAGEGNATRCIGEAERLRDTLHYKSERAMSFELFLSKTKKMINIFATEGEEWTEDAQIRWLFQKVQHPELRLMVSALKAQKITDPTLTFTTAANQLAAEVSQLPEFVSMRSRGISSVNAGGDKGRNGIYNTDGSIYTGFYKNWGSLSKEDREKVIQERNRLGIKKTGKGDGKRQRKTAVAKTKKKLAKVQKEMKELKRRVSSLKQAPGDDEDRDGDGKDESSVPDDAGNQFNGRRSKRNKKS